MAHAPRGPSWTVTRPAGWWRSTATARTRSYSYDEACQLIEARTSGQEGEVVRWRYDPAGRLVAETRDGTTRELAYDAAGQLVSSELDGRVLTYSYDLQGRRTSVSDADGSTREFGWSSTGWLASVVDQDAAGEQRRVTAARRRAGRAVPTRRRRGVLRHRRSLRRLARPVRRQRGGRHRCRHRSGRGLGNAGLARGPHRQQRPVGHAGRRRRPGRGARFRGPGVARCPRLRPCGPRVPLCRPARPDAGSGLGRQPLLIRRQRPAARLRPDGHAPGHGRRPRGLCGIPPGRRPRRGSLAGEQLGVRRGWCDGHRRWCPDRHRRRRTGRHDADLRRRGHDHPEGRHRSRQLGRGRHLRRLGCLGWRRGRRSAGRQDGAAACCRRRDGLRRRKWWRSAAATPT